MIPDTRQRLEEAVRELRGLVVRGRGGGGGGGQALARAHPHTPPRHPTPLPGQEEHGEALVGSEELAAAQEELTATLE